jgi:hypothetical protein
MSGTRINIGKKLHQCILVLSLFLIRLENYETVALTRMVKKIIFASEEFTCGGHFVSDECRSGKCGYSANANMCT